MRRYNPDLPLLKAGPPQEPIAIAFNMDYNIEVYDITETNVEMANDFGSRTKYKIRYTPYGIPFVVRHDNHIRINSFLWNKDYRHIIRKIEDRFFTEELDMKKLG